MVMKFRIMPCILHWIGPQYSGILLFVQFSFSECCYWKSERLEKIALLFSFRGESLLCQPCM